MPHLTRHDYAAALRLLASLEAEAAAGPQGFGRACVEAVSEFIAASSAVLHDGSPDGWQDGAHDGSQDPSVAVAHPLEELCVRLGEGPPPAALVLRRRVGFFSQRDRERLDLLRPHLAFLYRHIKPDIKPDIKPAAAQATAIAQPLSIQPANLTRRESEVMRWVACGKTDADIGALLAISPRTVNKHLEHIYVKLGVETRTAAVMRVRQGE